MIWYVYLVECVDGSLYTGITTDVDRRFAQHAAGKGARYTRSHAPLRVLASHPFGTKAQALRVEMAIKRLPKSQKLAAMKSSVFMSSHRGEPGSAA